MSILKRIPEWEKHPLSTVLWDLQKGFSIESKMEIASHSCESGVWINVHLRYDNRRFVVNGSRLDIVSRRLIEWIDRQGIREDFLPEEEEYIEEKCKCPCHNSNGRGIKHVAPCCDNGIIRIPKSLISKSL